MAKPAKICKASFVRIANIGFSRSKAFKLEGEPRLWPKRNFTERQRQEAKLCLSASESFCFSGLYLKLLVATKRSSRFCVTFSKKVTDRRVERVAGEIT